MRQYALLTYNATRRGLGVFLVLLLAAPGLADVTSILLSPIRPDAPNRIEYCVTRAEQLMFAGAVRLPSCRREVDDLHGALEATQLIADPAVRQARLDEVCHQVFEAVRENPLDVRAWQLFILAVHSSPASEFSEFDLWSERKGFVRGTEALMWLAIDVMRRHAGVGFADTLHQRAESLASAYSWSPLGPPESEPTERLVRPDVASPHSVRFQVEPLPVGHVEAVTALTLTGEGDGILSASEDGMILVRNLAGLRPQVSVALRRERITAAAWSSDKSVVAVAGVAWLRVQRAISGTVLWTAAVDAEFRDLWISSDSRFLIGTTIDSGVLVYDVASGRLVRALAAPDERLIGGCFGPKQESFWSWSASGKLFGWSLLDSRRLDDHDIDGVIGVSLDVSGEIRLVVNRDDRLALQSLNGRILASIQHENSERIVRYAASLDHSVVVLLNRKGRAFIWRTNQGLAAIPPSDQQDLVISIAVSPDARTVVVGNVEGDVRRIAVDEMKVISDYAGVDDSVTDAAGSPCGRFLLLFSRRQSESTLLDTKTLERRAKVRLRNKEIFSSESNEPIVTAIGLSTGARFVAAGNDAGQVDVREVASGKVVHSFHVPDVLITALSFSYGSTLLAAGTDAGRVFIWNLETKNLVKSFDTDKDSVIYSIIFSENDQRVVVDSSVINVEGTHVAGDAAHVQPTFLGVSPGPVAFDLNSELYAALPASGEDGVTDGRARPLNDVTRLSVAIKNLDRSITERGFNGPVVAVDTWLFLSKDSLLLAAEDAGCLSLWERASGQLLERFDARSTGYSLLLRLPDDDEAVAWTFGSNDVVRIKPSVP
jgi:WD40 repeat protein